MKCFILIWDSSINNDSVSEGSQRLFLDSLPGTRCSASDWKDNKDDCRFLQDGWCFGEVMYNMIYPDSELLKTLGIMFPKVSHLPAIYCMEYSRDGYRCDSKFRVGVDSMQKFIQERIADNSK